MRELSEPKPQPNQNDYTISIESLTKYFNENGGVQEAVKNFANKEQNRSHGMRHFVMTAAGLGSIMEPIDRTTGEPVDKDRTVTDAVIYGAVAGYMTMRDVYGEAITAGELLTDKIRLSDFEPDTDRFQVQHQAATEIIALGEQGLELVGQVGVDKIEEWEVQAIPDVRAQPFFRRAFGLLALNAHALYQVKLDAAKASDLKKMEAEIMAGESIDWDNWQSTLGL